MINFNKYRNIINWKIIEIKENRLHLEGEDRCWLPRNKYFYYCIFGNKKFYPKYYYFQNYNFDTLYGTLLKGRIIIFDILLDLSDEQIFNFYISFNHNNIEIFPSLEYLNHLPPINNSYYMTENYIIKNYNNHLYIYNNRKQEKLFEQNFCIELKKIQKDYLIELRKKYINEKKAIKYKKNNQIWLINDNAYKAGDNGEFFFRYLKQINPKNIQYYFIISKNCPDFNRLKSFHSIIDYNSSTHLDIFLKANKIITSVTDSWVNNPYDDNGRYIKDLYHFEYIYLKNGIIKDDISKFLNRIIFNFDLIVTSSNKEYKSFLNNNYGYYKKNIVLTGLPKHDNLKVLQKKLIKQKIILISPTWRMFIKGTRDLINHKSIRSENFKNTTYYNFYNDLINNKQILNYMKANNYYGIFCLHPNFAEQSIYFKQNEIFKVKKDCNIQKLLVASSLLITDYSSIFFDFAYLQKPIIFTHFDYNEYRKKHFPKGYFDYKRDGFGKICYNLNCTIEEIKYEITNKMVMKNLYITRAKRFFKYVDELNCYRTYISILESNNKNKLKHNKRFICLDNIFNFIILYILILKINGCQRMAGY